MIQRTLPIAHAIAILTFIWIPNAKADRAAPPAYATEKGLEMIYTGLDRFKQDCGRYPTTDEGLKAVSLRPANIKCRPSSIGDIFISQTDGWGKPHFYQSNGKSYLVRSSHGYSLTQDSPVHGNNHWTNPKPPSYGEPPKSISTPKYPPGMEDD